MRFLEALTDLLWKFDRDPDNFTGSLQLHSDDESYDLLSSPLLFSLRSLPRVSTNGVAVSNWQFGNGCRSDPRRLSHEKSVRRSALKRRSALPVAPGDGGASIPDRVARQRGRSRRISSRPAGRTTRCLPCDEVGTAGGSRSRRVASPICWPNADANGNHRSWERIPYFRSQSTAYSGLVRTA